MRAWWLDAWGQTLRLRWPPSWPPIGCTTRFATLTIGGIHRSSCSRARKFTLWPIWNRQSLTTSIAEARLSTAECGLSPVTGYMADETAEKSTSKAIRAHAPKIAAAQSRNRLYIIMKSAMFFSGAVRFCANKITEMRSKSVAPRQLPNLEQRNLSACASVMENSETVCYSISHTASLAPVKVG
jgi:predicted nuclease of predicted toxin-antitoxin system